MRLDRAFVVDARCRTSDLTSNGAVSDRDPAPGRSLFPETTMKRRIPPADAPRLLEQILQANPHLRDEVNAELDREIEPGDIARTVAKNIRRFRERRGMYQSDLADKIGIGQSSMSRLEAEEGCNCTLRTLLRVATALGVDIVALFESEPTALTAIPRRRNERDDRKTRGAGSQKANAKNLAPEVAKARKPRRTRRAG